MRLVDYLNERASDYGKGITFVDIDETMFRTFAMIHVINKETGKLIRKLDNQEFNSYQLKDNEEFNFDEFRSANLFYDTSKPIVPMVDRVKRMINKLKQNERESKLIFLTAREDFNDKEKFLDKFRKHGIDMNFKPAVYVERAGNIRGMPIPAKKEQVVMKYLKSDNYRRVRMIDDHIKNITQFMSISNKIPDSIKNNVKKAYNIPDGEVIMEFYGLYIDENGKLKLLDKKEIY